MTALSLAKPGMDYTIKWNVCRNIDDESADYIETLGLRPGAKIFLLNSYFGNVLISIKGKTVALSNDMAFFIKV